LAGRKKLKFFSGKFALVADNPQGAGKTTALCAKGHFGTCPRESFFRERLRSAIIDNEYFIVRVCNHPSKIINIYMW
jgi:hypothetical protein